MSATMDGFRIEMEQTKRRSPRARSGRTQSSRRNRGVNAVVRFRTRLSEPDALPTIFKHSVGARYTGYIADGRAPQQAIALDSARSTANSERAVCRRVQPIRRGRRASGVWSQSRRRGVELRAPCMRRK